MSSTKIWRVNDSEPEQVPIAEAGKLLRGGGTVAFPTETVYGLGANAGDTAAVEKIFAAKGRPSDNPLIVHIADREQLDALVLPFGETERRLMDRFWPGPLTLVLPVRPGAVSPRVTAGLDTVAVRMPAHPVALALIAAAGCPVAAPSANRSGRPSPTEAAHVMNDLDGRIDGIVDGGPASVGLESTVVEIEGGTVRILRPGGVTAEELLEVAERVEYDIGAVSAEPPGQSLEAFVRDGAAPLPVERGAGLAQPAGDLQAAAVTREDGAVPAESGTGLAQPAVDPQAAAAAVPAESGAGLAQPASDPQAASAPREGAAAAGGTGASARTAQAPRSPGMKYTHYAPRGVMELVQGSAADTAAYINAEAAAARMGGERTGVLAFAEHAALFDADHVIVAGSLARLETAARELYAALRAFDDLGVERIWAETCPEEGIGRALMNRLAKAAGHRIVRI